MSDLEKLNIYVPASLRKSLDKDAELFEVFKKDGRTINRNRLLSLILLGYFDAFEAQRLEIARLVERELVDAMPDSAKRTTQANNIAQALTSPLPLNQRGIKFERLSLKPTRETEGLIRAALSELSASDTVSRHFYSLLASYSSKPPSERERIVFKQNVDVLQEACRSGRAVSFTTIWDKSSVHKVTPYKLVVGQDEQFNYLMCYEEANIERRALAYRLNRISSPRILGTAGVIPEESRRHLSLMERLGPQYAINDDETACVRLSGKGVVNYQRIYFGRPTFDRVEHSADGDLYYFSGSKDQLFLYFRRFGPGEAEILAPSSLRARMIAFHSGALYTYNN